jgi:hypothetical protein
VMMFGARVHAPRLMNESAWILRALTAACEYFLGSFALGFIVSALWLVNHLRKGKTIEPTYPLDAQTEG